MVLCLDSYPQAIYWNLSLENDSDKKWMHFPADKSFSKIMIFSTTNWCGLRPTVNFNRSTVHGALFVGIILAINPVRYYFFRMFNNRKSWIHVFLCLETFLFSLFQKQVSALLIGQEWNQFLFFSLGQKIVTLRNKMTQDWWLIHLFDGETEKSTIGGKRQRSVLDGEFYVEVNRSNNRV